MSCDHGSAEQPATRSPESSAEQPAVHWSPLCSKSTGINAHHRNAESHAQPASVGGNAKKAHRRIDSIATDKANDACLCASQVFHTLEVSLVIVISYLTPREVAQGLFENACRSWRSFHQQHAYRSLVLTAGNPMEIDQNWNISQAHATVSAFLTAPLSVRETISCTTESLTLKIVNLDMLFNPYHLWRRVAFSKLSRLVIDGPIHIKHFRGLSLKPVYGLRLGHVLSRLGSTISTLILSASFSDEDDNPDDATMASLVASFANLKVLDILWPELGVCPSPQLSTLLQKCQGVGVDINNFFDSFVAHAPHLEQLHIKIHSWLPSCQNSWLHQCTAIQQSGALNITPFLCFLAKKCPQLTYLHIQIMGRSHLPKDAFSDLPRSVQWLVLCCEKAVIDGLDCRETDAGVICSYLRPNVPVSCRLFVLKGTYKIDIENALQCIMNPRVAASM